MRSRAVRAALAVLACGWMALLASPSRAGEGGSRPMAIPDDWRAAEQPDLKARLDAAPPLPIEDLGVAVRGVDVAGINVVPNPDGKGWDVLVWYRKAYRRNTRVYIADLGAGTVTKQAFPEEEGKVRVEMGFSWWGVFGPDGNLYGANPDWTKWSTGGAMDIYRYSPAENRVSLFKVIPGHGGERNPMALSPDGWIYGAGTHLAQGEDNARRASAFGFNPRTGEVRDFGAVGPRINGTGYGYSMGCCDTHVYVACGQIPWYLVAVEIATGKQEVLATAPEGGYVNRMFVKSRYPGAEGWVQQVDDGERVHYWLYHGKAIPKKDPNEAPPWPAQPEPMAAFGPRPEVHEGMLYPDENDRAALWWRPNAEAEWRSVILEGVEKHALELHRLAALPDGRLFGSAGGYKGRFLFDPAAGRVIELGDGGASTYAFVVAGDRLYWSGYPSAPIYEFDPRRPWTLEKGTPPGVAVPAETSAESNPRRVHEDLFLPFKKTRVKKMLSGTLAGDGRIYFGGKGQRDYEGGGLSWYDPKAGELDGMWKPFVNREIGWVTPACAGRYVVIGMEGSKAGLYDTQTRQLSEFETVPGARKTGPMLEVAPGRLLGATYDPADATKGVLYGVDVPEGKVRFTKRVPYPVPFQWAQGIAKWDYVLGPDGFVWATLGGVLARIDPRDATVHPVGRLDPRGKMAFLGRDLYLTGTESLRRARNIVPQ